MIEFTEYRRNPCAPQLFVNKLGGLYRVSGNITKVTFVLASSPNETVEAASLLWDGPDLHEADQALRWALDEIRRGTFVSAEDGVRMIRAH